MMTSITNVLLDMLTYRRPAFSSTEEDFISTFLAPLEPHKDDYGNLWIQVGEAPGILWSSHTDTVHYEPGRQKIGEVVSGIVSLDGAQQHGNDKPNCLGADCAAGVWLMREMILAKKTGLYIFHRAEERGGLGSSYITTNHADNLSGIKFAIALDRKGDGDVITHQRRRRTASDAFARSLAAILGGAYRPDNTGVFTDTANYAGIIGECSNISIGYSNAHSPREMLNLNFVLALRDTLIDGDFSTLVSERKPGPEADSLSRYTLTGVSPPCAA